MPIIPSAAMKKFRILIVDNDDPFRQILKKTLRVSLPTIAIDEATGRIEALQKIDAFLPDLIFMDIQLPGENGLTLTRKIKASHPSTIIVILTSYDKPEYREVAIRNGADRFLVKTSLNPKELEELVKYYFWRPGFDFADSVKRGRVYKLMEKSEFKLADGAKRGYFFLPPSIEGAP